MTLSTVAVLFALLSSFVVTRAVGQNPSSFEKQILAKQDEILQHLRAQEAVINSLQQCARIEEIDAILNKLKTDGECSNFWMGGKCPPMSLNGAAVSTQNIPCPDMLQEVATGKSTFCSSVHPYSSERDYVAELAVDGNDTTMFNSRGTEENPWWIVDLGTQRTLYHIIILPRQNCCPDRFNNIEIRLGDTIQSNGDLTSYKLLHFYKGPYTLEEGRLMYTFCSGITGRYLSLQQIGSGYLSVNTVQAIALRI